MTRLSWGDSSLYFNLPVQPLLLQGLSCGQVQALRSMLPHLLLPAPPRGARVAHCRVTRLTEPVSTSPGAFDRDGEYVLQMSWHEQNDEHGIRGQNFAACLSGDGASSTLAVYGEHELATLGVVENFFRVLSAHQALASGGVLLHSAGLVYRGRAYIFCGHSNAGKTTLTRKAHAAGARVLSDDINLILPGPAGYRALGVPFTGEFGRTIAHIGPGESFPIARLFALQQSDELRLEALGRGSAMASLLAGSPFANASPSGMTRLLEVLPALVDALPMARLYNRLDDDIHAIRECLLGASAVGVAV